MSGYKTDADRALEKERKELLDMLKEQEELAIRIAKKQRRVAALATLVDDSEGTDAILGLDLYGLTNAIRTALKSASPQGLTPDEIKTTLGQLSFPVDEYSNFRASLNNVLKRLVAAGEIRIAIHDIHQGRDQSVYQWIQKYGAAYSKYDPKRSKWKESKDKSVRDK